MLQRSPCQATGRAEAQPLTDERSTVVLDLKAHPPAGHTRAAGAVFQGTGQGTPQDPPRRQPRPGSSGLGTILGTGSGLGQDWVRTGHTLGKDWAHLQIQCARPRAA